MEKLNTKPLDIVKIESPDFYIYGPKIALDQWPGVEYDKFPINYCGAGHGLGEKIVPDFIGSLWFKVKVSPACWAHDMEWEFAPPTWDAFHASNSRLLGNICRMIEQKCKYSWLKVLYRYRAATYYNAVSTAGIKIFWRLKKKQGHVIPDNAKYYSN